MDLPALKAERSRQRHEAMASLKTLLGEIPGAKTPWEVIANTLARRLPVEILTALAYRVHAARTESFNEGVEIGRRYERGGNP